MGDEGLAALRRDLLEAREARQATLARLRGADGSIVFLSVGVPGPDKRRPGLAALQRLAAEALDRALPVTPLESGRDAVGPWAAFRVRPPARSRQARHRRSRVLASGRPAHRSRRLRPGRRAGRSGVAPPAGAPVPGVRPAGRGVHPPLAAFERQTCRPPRTGFLVRVLASSLAAGARTELELTPKPGLVDRLDCGSHPDLSFDAMSRSIDLLPAYFEDLLGHADPPDLPACVEAGRAGRATHDRRGRHQHAQGLHLPGRARPARGRDVRGSGGSATAGRRNGGANPRPPPAAGRSGSVDHAVARRARQGRPRRGRHLPRGAARAFLPSSTPACRCWPPSRRPPPAPGTA